MNTPPVIRRYEPDDVHSLIEIYQRAIHVLAAPFYNKAQLDAWAPALMDPAKWHARVSPQQTFIADCDGRARGFIAWDWTGHIDFIFTHPVFARRGLAGALYAAAEKSILQHGAPRLFAEVIPFPNDNRCTMVGRRCCAAGLEGYAAAQPYREKRMCRLSVRTRISLAARPFFESRGFVSEREQEVDCRGQRIRQFIMSKPLA